MRGVRGQTRKIPRQICVILCPARVGLVLSNSDIRRRRNQDKPIRDKKMWGVKSPSGTKISPEK